MTTINAWWLAARPKTLPASISPVILGTALAYQVGQYDWLIFFLSIVCAMLLQIAVNFANDYFDFFSGVDTKDRLGPIRVSQSGLIAPSVLKRVLLVVCGLATFVGLLLVWLSSWWLLLFGIASVCAVFMYSSGPWPLASNGMGEVAVFFFFGWLAVGGTFFAHTNEMNEYVLGFGSVAGLISAGIMLVNNIRDIKTDSASGKRTLAVILGEKRARALYRLLLISVLCVHLVVSGLASILAFVPLVFVAPLLWYLSVGSRKLTGRELNGLLANTAKLALLYCVITSAMIVIVTGC